MSELKLDVATPERVAVELPIAGIGYRAIAYLVDVGLVFAVSITLYFLYSLAGPSIIELYDDASRTLRIVAMIAIFVVLWGYWTIFEVVWNGQTIGKRLMHIRVVRSDGSPVTFFESAVRNLLRIVDFLPSCYPVGVVTMLIDQRHRRLGDLVAGTLLVREESFDLARYERVAVPSASTQALSPQVIELVTGYLSRFHLLDEAPRLLLGRKIAAKLGYDPNAPPLEAEALREFLVARLEGK